MKSIYTLCIIFAFSNFAPKDNNLVAYWDFDEVKKGEIKDKSGNGLHAFGTNVLLSEGIKGKAFYGKGNFLQVNHQPILDHFEKGITISAWVYREASTTWNCIVTRQTKNNTSEYFDVGVFKNKPLFSIDGDGDHFLMVEHPDSLPVQQWIHLAGTYDNSAYRLFINGKMVAMGQSNIKYKFTDTNPLLIGANTNDRGVTINDFFYGKIDELKIFNRPLSEEEIKKLNNN